MKAFDYKLAEQILRSTTRFDLDQMLYKVNKDGMIVWSKNARNGGFYQADVIPLFAMFSVYLGYNDEFERVELRIY